MRSWLHLDLVRLAAWGVPLVIGYVLVIGRIPPTEQPRGLFVLMVLLLGACLWHARQTRRRHPRTFGPDFLRFFFALVLLLFLADSTDLLAGRRVPLNGFEQIRPKNLLGLGHWGDWRYRIAPQAPPADHLAVVLVPPVDSRNPRPESRLRLASLVDQAVIQGARGLALDFFLEQPSELDAFLAARMDAARQAGLPVVLGARRGIRGSGSATGLEIVPELRTAAAAVGHLHGYLEADGRLRLIPVHMPGMEPKAFSLVIAEYLAPATTRPPADRLLRFTAPGDDELPVVLPDAAAPPDWTFLRDRFVVVGSTSPDDVFPTAYDAPGAGRPGAVIHAWAAHSLAADSYLVDLPPGLTLPGVFLLCYLVAVIHAREPSPRKSLLVALALTGGVLIAGIAAARLRLWVDLVYPLIGIWSLTAVRLFHRSPASEVSRPAVLEKKMSDRPFDVFVSHNSSDKPAVRELCLALRERGLRPWLDEEQLIPGRPWQETLEEAVETAAAVAVLVGNDGLGPWEEMEMRGALTKSVKEGLPVIPVLLPDAPSKPRLPLFLTQYTWVDLRGGLTPEGLDRLQWGVTGRRPGAESERS